MNRSRSTWLRLFAGVSALSGAALWFVLFIGPQWGFLGQGYRPNGIAAGAALVLVGLALLLGADDDRWALIRRWEFLVIGATACLVGGAAVLPYFGSRSLNWAHELNAGWYVAIVGILGAVLCTGHRLDIRLPHRQ
jgi:hypothetical protein